MNPGKADAEPWGGERGSHGADVRPGEERLGRPRDAGSVSYRGLGDGTGGPAGGSCSRSTTTVTKH